MTESLITINGAKMYVADTGDDLPAVLCLHSLFLDARMFDGLVERAAGKYRIIRPEWRGQGRSDLVSGDMITMDQLADDMFALIDHLGLTEINLIAQSMGGDVAVRLAARRPELFRSLVMAGSSARNEPNGQREDFLAWVGRAGEQGFINDSLEDTMNIMFGSTSRNTSDPKRKETVALWRDRINATPRHLYPAMLGVIVRESAVHLLPDITCPTLVFSGEEDTARPPAWAEEVADGIPGAHLVTLENVGHSPTLEIPDTVYPMILDFLDLHNVTD